MSRGDVLEAYVAMKAAWLTKSKTLQGAKISSLSETGSVAESI